jgi:hypothetical protein
MKRILPIAFAAAAILLANSAVAEVCVNDAWYPGKYKLCVSSVLQPQGRNNYGPGNLSPRGEGNGAWCEGVKGNGIGESISFRFIGGAKEITIIEMLNGYHKSDKHYVSNGRVRSLAISSDRGNLGVFHIDDAKYAEIRIPKARYKWLKLKIMSVYPGRNYTDVCVTAISPM